MIELLILTLVLGPKSFSDERPKPIKTDSVCYESVDYSAGFRQIIVTR